ncbi:MAG: hypothetical protein ABSG68_18195 [Thermoguttaceae bacterium]|jgi:hypothetical protein
MLKYLSLSLALHLAIVGYLAYRCALGATSAVCEGQADCVFADEGECGGNEFVALDVSIEDPATELRKLPTFIAGALAFRGDNRPAAKDALFPARFAIDLQRAAPANFDTVKALEDAIHGPGARRIESLQQSVAEAEKMPLENLSEITNKLRADYGVQDHAYEPKHEAKDGTQVDLDHSVVFYRLVTKDGKRCFQELALDRDGNYLVVSEKDESSMDMGDKAKLQVFSNPVLSSIRNIALGIVEKKLEDQGKPKP